MVLFLPFSYWPIARFDSLDKDKQVLKVNLRNSHNISFTGMQRTKEVIHNQVHQSDVEMEDLYDMWHESDVEMVSDDERDNPFTQSRVKTFFSGKKTVQPQKQQQDKSYMYKERTPFFTDENGPYQTQQYRDQLDVVAIGLTNIPMLLIPCHKEVFRGEKDTITHQLSRQAVKCIKLIHTHHNKHIIYGLLVLDNNNNHNTDSLETHQMGTKCSNIHRDINTVQMFEEGCSPTISKHQTSEYHKLEEMDLFLR